MKELLIDTSESVSDNWVRGLRSIRKDAKVSTSGDKKKKLISHEDDAETRFADERWLDDGGVSGEEVI
ncbi:MAG: hypothetical protein EPO24_12045 [Bacteroidetes bacterium]|nr:MAG: hypothetical protein EPO24_12045 [Bacteroidota bacterium]